MMDDFVKAELNDEELEIERQKWRKCQEAEVAYYAAHRVCPKCRLKNYSTTLNPFRMRPGEEETFRNFNTIRCGCGWVGERHDLVAN
jgi:hypothetical protein